MEEGTISISSTLRRGGSPEVERVMGLAVPEMVEMSVSLSPYILPAAARSGEVAGMGWLAGGTGCGRASM